MSLNIFLLTTDVVSALLFNEMMLSPGRDIKYQLHLAECTLELVFVYLLTAAEVFGFAAFLLFVHQSDLISQLLCLTRFTGTWQNRRVLLLLCGNWQTIWFVLTLHESQIKTIKTTTKKSTGSCGILNSFEMQFQRTW